MKDKLLLAIRLDKPDNIELEYSDGLFDWFFDKVKYVSHNVSIGIFEEANINMKRTKDDLSSGGCRIYQISKDTGEGYIKLYDCQILLLEFDDKDSSLLIKEGLDIEPELPDIVNYYYKHIKK